MGSGQVMVSYSFLIHLMLKCDSTGQYICGQRKCCYIRIIKVFRLKLGNLLTVYKKIPLSGKQKGKSDAKIGVP